MLWPSNEKWTINQEKQRKQLFKNKGYAGCWLYSQGLKWHEREPSAAILDEVDEGLASARGREGEEQGLTMSGVSQAGTGGGACPDTHLHLIDGPARSWGWEDVTGLQGEILTNLCCYCYAFICLFLYLSIIAQHSVTKLKTRENPWGRKRIRDAVKKTSYSVTLSLAISD